MTKPGTIRWIWSCHTCKDVVVSRSDERHTMDSCKCGATKVDLEESYARGSGQDSNLIKSQEWDGSKWNTLTEKEHADV